jgi:hypothetical protein
LHGRLSSWFARIDYRASEFQGSCADDRCPEWHLVRLRRTYDLDTGKLLQSRAFAGDSDFAPEPIPGIVSFNIVTFLYEFSDPSKDFYADEVAFVTSYRPDMPTSAVKPDASWHLVIIPRSVRDAARVNVSISGTTGSCSVVVTPPIDGSTKGVQIVADVIRPLLGQFFVFVFVGADSSLSPFVGSAVSLPPHDACWWESTGALFVKLCSKLVIDAC